jgi:hypothetical protein
MFFLMKVQSNGNPLCLFTAEHIEAVYTCQYYSGRHGRHCMVVVFTTTYAISAYHH